jgi:hypothetical protein
MLAFTSASIPSLDRLQDELARRNSNVRPSFSSFTKRTRPIIDIQLNDQQDTYVSSYSTLDKIEGTVIINTPSDLKFDDIIITFEGITRTYVEKVATSAPANVRTQAYHNFLKLTQPLDDSSFPENNQFKENRSYRFPFTFVVPEKLLPHSCTHHIHNPSIQTAHLNLPPSLGDPMLSSDGVTLLNDMAPDMSKIQYMIKVKIVKRKETDGKLMVVSDVQKKLRIIPAVEEEPPMSIPDDDEDYALRREKDVKKGLFKGKIGRITVEAAQPKSLRLPPPNTDSNTPVTTMAAVNLRFDPIDENVQPPRLGSIWSKLKVYTFFGSSPMRNFPSKSSVILYDSYRGLFSETAPLASRCIASQQWERHESEGNDSNELARRDSTFSVCSGNGSIPEASAAYNGKTFYTARILVPVNLPKNKAFTPTFHSCLVSRIYTLDLTLSYHPPGTSVSSPMISLKLPIQISSQPRENATATISEEEMAAIAAREAIQDYFQPRSVAPPSPEYTERAELVRPSVAPTTSDQAPPGYTPSFFTRRRVESAPVVPSPPVGVAPAC